MSESSSSPARVPVPITRALLQRWQLPPLDGEGDKNSRGGVLIVGGSAEMPGALILAATAALRSGVGRLRVATGTRLALAVGVAVPEARVFALPESPGGGIDPAAADQIAEIAGRAQALLLGPGMIDDAAIEGLRARLLPQLGQVVLILDAGALTAGSWEPRALAAREGATILTPHAGELAHMYRLEKAAVAAAPQELALRAAADAGAVLVLKGPATWIANTAQELYCYQEGDVGLAASGSGDALAGMIAGLAARAASPTQAAAWGVYLHGAAGNRLTQRLGRVGFLTRELPGELPQLLAEIEHDDC